MRIDRPLALSVSLFLCCVLATPMAWAAAQPESEPTPEPMRSPDTVHVDFRDADTVGGTRHDPGTDLEQMRTVRAWRSLVKVRADFVPELLESAETL
jgi:hypothetical protein